MKKWVVFLPLLLPVFACTLTSFGEDESPARTEPPAGGAAPAATAAVAPVLSEDAACTRYVSAEGDDSGPGTETQPWAGFQQAAEGARPGDVVCFAGGIYAVDEEVHLTRSGTAESPITFRAAPGQSPVLDGGGEAGGILVFDAGSSHLRVSGFSLRSFTVWGVELSGGNRYVHLDHLEINGGDAAVHLTYGESGEAPEEGPVEYITLEDSIIHGSVYTAIDCTPGPCNHMTVRRVEITGSGMEGDAFYGSDGLAVERGYPVLVEDCYIHDNGGDGIDLNSRDRSGNAEGVIVRRNRVIRNHLNGIKLWAGGLMEGNILWGQGNSPVWVGVFPSTVEALHNTVAYNMWDETFSQRNWSFVAGYPEEMDSPPVQLTLLGNIFAFNADPMEGGPTGIYLGPGVTLVREGDNLFYSRESGEITAEFAAGRDSDFTRSEIADGTWAAFSGQGQNDLTVDPLFLAGWPNVDLQVQPGSPAAGLGAR
ncbi:MAG: right-handed parallel beta-helix repeat-containing protein [Anaerolineales bacterium]